MEQLKIGACRFSPDSGELSSACGTECLPPQVAKVFYQLALQQGQIVSRSDLMDAAWPNQVVSDESLTHSICAIRKMLKKNACGINIETLHKRGYRLKYCKKPCAGLHKTFSGISFGNTLSAAAILITVLI